MPMPAKVRMVKILMVAAVAGLAFHAAPARSGKLATAGATAAAASASATAPAAYPKPADAPDAHAALGAAADALGMLRTAVFAPARTPRLDVLNTMEFRASGTPFSEYHAAIVYNPPSMRVEFTNPNGNPQHAIEVVSGKYAWNESQIGGGLIPGKGTATPQMMADKERLLRLWILPYGVVKAGLAAGDKAKVSNENGMTVVTFPLTGELQGVTVKATLDAKNLVTKVETQGPGNLSTETEYMDYADRGEIPTNVLFPGHIVRKRDGKVVLDVQMKMVDTNNPYIVIPIPDNVLKGS
jgi:hypothetical protein